MRFISLRYFNAAGYHPGGRVRGLEKNPANLIPVVMEVAAGIRDQVEVYGDDYPTKDGTGVRDYIHVTDLALAHLKSFDHIMETRQSAILNLGTGQGHSVMDIIKMAEKVSGKNIRFKVVSRRAGDPADLHAKADKANDLIGWVPKFSDLKTMIESTWRLYR
jgi:UDP-glucose 4-epimerase